MNSSFFNPEWGDEAYTGKVARNRWGSYISEVEEKLILRGADLAKRTRNHTALDIGCGGGRWSKLLSDVGWNVISTDISANDLGLCKKKVPTAKCILVVQDDTTLPCETESLGLVLCIEVGVVLEDWFSTEVFRVLQPSGLIVGVMWNNLSFRGVFHNLVGFLKGRRKIYPLSYPRWKNNFRAKGFRMIEEKGICWFPFSRKSNSALVPIFIKIEQYAGLSRLPSVSPWIVFVAQKVSPI